MKKILIVEDDIDTINVVALMLEADGFIVITVNRVIELKEIEGINPSLIILDYLLPFGLGDELCVEIKNYPGTKHIPVILYSASNGLPEIANKCKADAYIPKPFEMDYFLSEVNRLAKLYPYIA